MALIRRQTKPTLPEVKPIINAFYELPGNAVGGKLHCVLDDYNWERKFVVSCEKEAHDAGDMPAYRLAQVLMMLSNSQRRRAC